MNKLITKARSGVTLVELLVVILIVTILSVSMLPLLQPFVTEAQYAAEAIPVIANIRTKIGVYQYDKGRVPGSIENQVVNPTTHVATWMPHNKDPLSDIYSNAVYTIDSGLTSLDEAIEYTSACHIGTILDIDYQDLRGKRSRPSHYQYFVIATNFPAYVVGCFGNGQGLKAGTGYAVCEITFPAANRKLVGTWKRYKSKSPNDNDQIVFSSDENDTGMMCFVPKDSEINAYNSASAGDKDGEVDKLIGKMERFGWEF